MTKDEALKLALEALEEHHYGEAQIIIREALAQPAQEPDALTIAYQSGYYDGKKAAQREWVGLTDEEIHRKTILAGFNPEWNVEIGLVLSIVRNLEAKLKEKNS